MACINESDSMTIFLLCAAWVILGIVAVKIIDTYDTALYGAEDIGMTIFLAPVSFPFAICILLGKLLRLRGYR